MPSARTALLGGLSAGVGLLGYALVEARMPVLRRVDAPVLAPGQRPLRILHLADLHLTDRTEARVAWVRSLVGTRPDVVVNTGDNLSFASGLEPLARALEPFVHLPGAFVMGDHDYRTTVFKLPTRYLRRDPRSGDDPEHEAAIKALPWQEVRELQTVGGWVDLTNTRGALMVGERRIDLVGVDDPHVDRDEFPTAAPAVDGDAAVRDFAGRPLRLGLVHAPYRRVLDAMAGDGVGIAFAGHTHGGQLCLPGYGALVTNCDLDRGRVSGLSRWPNAQPGGRDAESMFLHVSAGLGTSPYTPVRLACRPEATLLPLRPAE